TVFLAGGLTPEQLLVLSANIAASGHPGVLLLDSGKATPHHKRFLSHDRAEQLVPIGCFNEDASDIEERLGTPAKSPLPWSRAMPRGLWQTLFPAAERAVICPAAPYRLLLQAACLAGVLRVPLYMISEDSPDEVQELRRQLSDWKTQTIYAIGNA